MKQRKIVIINPNKQAPSETFVKAHKECLKGEIIYLYGGANNLFDDEDKPIVRFMPQPSRIWSVLPFYLHYRIFQSWYFPNPTDVLSYFLKLKKVSVVLAEYGTTGAAVWDACQKAGVSLIIHFHGFDANHKPTLEKYLPEYQKAFKYASYVIGVSKAMCQKLLTLGVPSEKLIYNPYGVNDIFFDLQPSYQSPIFVAIGRLVDKKAPYLTLLAFQRVKQKHPEARLLIGGTGKLLDVCINLNQLFSIGAEFLGAVSHEQVKELFSKAFCFVQHSVEAIDGDSEGTPVAVIEAQAAGLPVVSTLHAGIPDVVIDGETGFLVSEKDVDAMAQKMLLLYENRTLAEQMGKKAKARAKEHFTMQRHIGQLDALFDALLA
jgi:glycosyltransferase involved in cell wall biosynthesis